MNRQLSNWTKVLFAPQNRWFVLAVVVLLAARCFHMQEALDGPHAWRQSDTANYIWDFYENGIDLLHPAVCWRGGHKTVILEFPLHEAIVAVFYKLFGPSHIWARLVTLFFFLLSCIYLFKIVRHLIDKRTAQFATVIYMALPLSMFYSRAIHIDFMVVGLAHAMLWYYLQGIEKSNWKLLLIGTLFAIPAFMIKAPYAFYFMLPLLWWTWKQKKFVFAFKSAWIFVLPLVFFGWWLWHTKTVNAMAPDWSFIPGYHKFTEMSDWYFGSWNQRTILGNWEKLWGRYLHEVAGWTGFVLSTLGLFLGRKTKNLPFFLLWFFGSIVYVLIFFNLNVIHNYYQIPMLAPVAIFGAFALNFLYKFLETKTKWTALVWLIPAGLIAENIHYSDSNYYKVNAMQRDIGKVIQTHTQKDNLIIVSWGGLGVNYPNILYQAKRNGWSIAKDFLDPQTCYKLYEAGATHLAVVRKENFEGEMAHFTNALPFITASPVNETGDKLYLWELDKEKLQPSNPK